MSMAMGCLRATASSRRMRPRFQAESASKWGKWSSFSWRARVVRSSGIGMRLLKDFFLLGGWSQDIRFGVRRSWPGDDFGLGFATSPPLFFLQSLHNMGVELGPVGLLQQVAML